MLAPDGHQVMVLEADPAAFRPLPARRGSLWQRKGVAQFRQPHNLFPRFRQVCDQELPEMTAAAGGRLRVAGTAGESAAGHH